MDVIPADIDHKNARFSGLSKIFNRLALRRSLRRVFFAVGVLDVRERAKM